MSKINYSELPVLKDIYLEDSFVLGITENEDFVEFKIEAVLTEQNPYYSLPKKNEQYYYKNIILLFSKIKKKEWVFKNLKYSQDISGEKDLGNIDSLTIDEDTGIYDIQGDWGHLILTSPQVFLEYK